MKIVFENLENVFIKTLSIEKSGNNIYLSCKTTSIADDDIHSQNYIILDKTQLSELIGGLLHVQSKMRK